ncbi:MAG: hypothetical protein FIA92_14460 [Chloroflexi bacterium]|nr:hypothetical protein [Chloroflexota bacterium]
MKPFGPLLRCGNPNCVLCNPRPLAEEESYDLPTLLIATAFGTFLFVIVAVVLALGIEIVPA